MLGKKRTPRRNSAIPVKTPGLSTVGSYIFQQEYFIQIVVLEFELVSSLCSLRAGGVWEWLFLVLSSDNWSITGQLRSWERQKSIQIVSVSLWKRNCCFLSCLKLSSCLVFPGAAVEMLSAVHCPSETGGWLTAGGHWRGWRTGAVCLGSLTSAHLTHTWHIMSHHHTHHLTSKEKVCRPSNINILQLQFSFVVDSVSDPPAVRSKIWYAVIFSTGLPPIIFTFTLVSRHCLRVWHIHIICYHCPTYHLSPLDWVNKAAV